MDNDRGKQMNRVRCNKLYGAIWMAFLAGIADTRAEVSLDGSLGPASGKIGANGQGIHQIDANKYGAFSRNNRNVFFSFDKFGVDAGKTALFYCGAGCGGTRNVISRVTDPNGAIIDGTLKSEIGGRDGNFFLLSPNGVIFGEEAVLDVPGTLNVSTAKSLKFDNGMRFSAIAKPGEEVSSLTADPTQFGFLPKNRKIAVQGLNVEQGKLQLSADRVEVEGTLSMGPGASTLEIVGNRIVVKGMVESGATVADPHTGKAPAVALLAGTVPVAEPDGDSETVVAADSAGEIEVDDGGTGNEGGGVVTAGNAGSLTVGSGRTSSPVYFSGADGQPFRTLSAREVRVRNAGIIEKTAGEDAIVKADAILVDRGARITTAPDARGTLTVEATGKDGSIRDPADGSKTLKALTVRDGAEITAGHEGDTEVLATHVDPVGKGADATVEVASQSVVAGNNVGGLAVGVRDDTVSHRVHVHDGGAIEKTADGNLTVKGEAVLVEGQGSRLTMAAGVSGTFLVEATGGDGTVQDPAGGGGSLKALTLRQGGQISGDQQGTIRVVASAAGASVDVDGGRIEGGNDGNLQVGFNDTATSRLVHVHGGGAIGKTGGDGNLSVKAESVLVEGEGSRIAASPAAAGTLEVEATGADETVHDPAGGGRTLKALTVRKGGAIAGDQDGDMTLAVSNAAPATVDIDGGHVTAANSGDLEVGFTGGATARQVHVHGGGSLRKTGGADLAVKAGTVLVEGAGSAIEAAAPAAGALTLEAASDLTVRDGGRIAGGNAGDLRLLARTGTVRVLGGGVVEKTAGRGNSGLTVRARRITVDGGHSQIAKRGAGGFSVAATGPDPTDGTALAVKNGGQILGNGGTMNVVTGRGSVGVASGGRIASVRGNMTIGNAASRGVIVESGGVIEKTADGDLAVTAKAISVTGRNSRIGKRGAGNLAVTATEAGPALSVNGGGRIFSQSPLGGMALSARKGTLAVGGANAIQADNRGNFEIDAETLRVTGTGQGAARKPVVAMTGNVATATLKANEIQGVANTGALIRASNRGDLILSPREPGGSLRIDPIELSKDSPGDILFPDAGEITLQDVKIKLDSGTADGGNIVFGRADSSRLQSVTLEETHLVNRGSGTLKDSNNIRFYLAGDSPSFRMIHSIVETRTSLQGQGGNITIDPLSTRISFGTPGRGLYQVIPADQLEIEDYVLNLPDYTIPALGVSVFGASSQVKFSDNITLNATAAVQAATLSVVATPVSQIDPNAVGSDPCGKGGSSLSLSGSAGFAAEPSVALPFPAGGAAPTASAAEGGTVAAAVRPDDSECE